MESLETTEDQVQTSDPPGTSSNRASNVTVPQGPKPKDRALPSVGRLLEVLQDGEKTVSHRIPAIIALLNHGTREASATLAMGLQDRSTVVQYLTLKCLAEATGAGTLSDKVIEVLGDEGQEPMVRVAAAEALGVIARQSPETTSLVSLDALEQGCSYQPTELSDACKIALSTIEYHGSEEAKTERLPKNPLVAVGAEPWADPAPPFPIHDQDYFDLQWILLNEEETLHRRLRALYSLRNLNSPESRLAIKDGLECRNIYLRVQVADVLGQLSHNGALAALQLLLHDNKQNMLVRKICAESMAEIGGPAVQEDLRLYLDSGAHPFLRDTCEAALDAMQEGGVTREEAPTAKSPTSKRHKMLTTNDGAVIMELLEKHDPDCLMPSRLLGSATLTKKDMIIDAIYAEFVLRTERTDVTRDQIRKHISRINVAKAVHHDERGSQHSSDLREEELQLRQMEMNRRGMKSYNKTGGGKGRKQTLQLDPDEMPRSSKSAPRRDGKGKAAPLRLATYTLGVGALLKEAAVDRYRKIVSSKKKTRTSVIDPRRVRSTSPPPTSSRGAASRSSSLHHQPRLSSSPASPPRSPASPRMASGSQHVIRDALHSPSTPRGAGNFRPQRGQIAPNLPVAGVSGFTPQQTPGESLAEERERFRQEAHQRTLAMDIREVQLEAKEANIQERMKISRERDMLSQERMELAKMREDFSKEMLQKARSDRSDN